MNWEDVDLDGSKLSVRRSLKVTDRGLAFGPAKNKASRRSVPLNRSAAAVLIAHRLRQNEERLRLGELWKDHSLVFPNRVGKPINHSNLYKRKFTVLLEKQECRIRASPYIGCATTSPWSYSGGACTRR